MDGSQQCAAPTHQIFPSRLSCYGNFDYLHRINFCGIALDFLTTRASRQLAGFQQNLPQSLVGESNSGSQLEYPARYLRNSFAPFWYRLLGAKVGRNAEISTAQGLIPDLLTLGDESFIADAVMLGDEAISGGWMTPSPDGHLAS